MIIDWLINNKKKWKKMKQNFINSMQENQVEIF